MKRNTQTILRKLIKINTQDKKKYTKLNSTIIMGKLIKINTQNNQVIYKVKLIN